MHKPRKILFDVGGFHGTSSLAGLDPLFQFDRIFIFEPSAVCCQIIAKIVDTRVVLVHAGLSNKSTRIQLYNSGNIGASVYQSAPTLGHEGIGINEHIRLLNTADFVQVFCLPGDELYIKLNCEGSEIDILDSLLTDLPSVIIKNILIDLDALKIPSQSGRVHAIMERVRSAGFSFFTPEEVQYGMVSNYGGVRNWLIEAGACRDSGMAYLRSLAYNIYVAYRFPSCNGYHKKIILDRMPCLSIFARSRRNIFRR